MPVDEIVAYADVLDADLIFVGSRGRGARVEARAAAL
jgi:nucleotide-binding universal stress UspA family protein